MAFEGGAPEGWKVSTFGEQFDFKGGSQPPKSTFVYEPKDGFIRLLQIRDFETDDKPAYIQKDATKVRCTERDILIARYGASLGRILTGKAGAYNVAMAKVVLPPKGIGRDFAYYWLQSGHFQSWVTAIGSRSAQAGFNKDDLAPCPFDVPPLAEQKKIAEILGAVDDAIIKTKSVIDSYRRILNALSIKEFSCVASIFDGEAPSGWKHTTLGACFVQSKSKGDSSLPTASVTMNRGLVRRSSVDRIVRSELASEDHLKVEKGQIAYNMMRMWQGVCGVAVEDCNISPAYVVLKPCDNIDPWYFYYAFKSPPLKQLLEGYSQGIVDDRLRLYYHHFSDIPVNIPSHEHQREWSNILRQLDNMIKSENDLVETLSKIKARMLDDLLSGRKRVTSASTSAEIIPFPSRPATLAAYICRCHQGSQKFGSAKLEKILHFGQYAALQGKNFPRTPERQAAGPHDPRGRREIAKELEKQKWFKVAKDDGPTTYTALSKLVEHQDIFEQQFSVDERTSIDRIIALLKPLTKDECGLYATLYASWNDFLLSGRTPTDKEIIDDVLTNWHPEKAKTPRKEWKAGLNWLRNNDLVPEGVGPKTARAGGQGFLV